jgi:hypothetical protein
MRGQATEAGDDADQPTASCCRHCGLGPGAVCAVVALALALAAAARERQLGGGAGGAVMAAGGGDGGGITGRIVGQDGHRAHLVRNRSQLPAWVPPAEGAAAVETADVVVVGGGVAGLVAAWRLASSGVFDGAGGGTNKPGRAAGRPRPRPRVVVLELEEQAGGNSLPGFDPASGLRYPWGAHLVPVPSTVGPGAHAKSSARAAV